MFGGARRRTQGASMKRSIVSLAASAGLFALLGTAGPASAGLAAYVSGTGTDTGDCASQASPCRQISYALTQTDAFGTVHVLAGTYDFFTISSAGVNVIAEGTAVVLYGGGNSPEAAIAITSSAGAAVLLKGLTVNVVVGSAGSVLVNSNSRVIIEDCIIRYGTGGPGIDFQVAGASALPELTVKDTTIMLADASIAGPSGIRIRPSGSISVDALLDHVTIRTNTSGITIDGNATTGSNAVTIRNSVISGNSSYGVKANDNGGGPTNVLVEESTISNNASTGIVATGPNATIRLGNSTVTGNARGLAVASSGKIISQGGNVVRGNTVNGTFTSTEAQQ